jgi:peptidoglycan-associated lipoprotein
MVTKLNHHYKEDVMRSRSLAVAAAFALVFAFGLSACQKRAVTQPDTTQQAQQPAAQKEKEKITEKKLEAKVESVDTKDKEAQYAESKETMFSDILFDYDKYDVKATYKEMLRSVSSLMAKNSAARLSIEGHCDERGTNEYNLALGDRRAKAVKDYLVSLGVASGRVDVISYGEERPLCNDQTEECWTKNRRAHIAVLTKVAR